VGYETTNTLKTSETTALLNALILPYSHMPNYLMTLNTSYRKESGLLKLLGPLR